MFWQIRFLLVVLLTGIQLTHADSSSIPAKSPSFGDDAAGVLTPGNGPIITGFSHSTEHILPSGAWNGMGVADLSNVPGLPSPTLLVMNASGGSFLQAIDPRTGAARWTHTSSSGSHCQYNLNSTVKVVGRYLLVGQNSYSLMYNGSVLNGIGRVCVHDARTGAYLNTATGFYGGELFGSTIVGLTDSSAPNSELVAIAAPRRWNPVHNQFTGAVDIYRVSDIIQLGFFVLPIETIFGPWQLPVQRGSGLWFSNAYEFGAAMVNPGDMNNDGIDDLVITDPGMGYAGPVWILPGTTPFVGLFDSRRLSNGELNYAYRSSIIDFSAPLVRGGTDITLVRHGATRRLLVSELTPNTALTSAPLKVLDLSPTGTFTRVGAITVPAASTQTQPGPFPAQASRFGWTVTDVGDVSGDGIADIAVTEPLRNGLTLQEQFAGAVHLLSGQRILGQPFQGAASAIGLYSPNEFNVRFGYGRNGVTGIPDANGDGIRDLVVGSPWSNGGNGGVVVLGR